MIDRRMRQLDIEPLDNARPIVRTGAFVAAGFLVAFTIYGSLAPISSAAIASGEVVVNGDRLVIQPLASGVVTQLFAHEGQAVRRGQPLVQLHGLRAGAELAQSQARRDALVATEARLLAERDGLPTIAFPDDLTRRAREFAVADAMKAERAIFREHRAIRLADRRLTNVELASARAQQVATVRQLGLIDDELSSYRDLYDKGFARKTTVRALERNAAQLQAERATGAGAVREAAIQRARTRQSQLMDTLSQLAQVRAQIAQAAPALDISRYVAGRTLLTAPVAGHVSGVLDLGPGTTVGGGQTLMELVPDRPRFIIQAQVAPKDIDDVRIGQPATVRFATVNPHGQTAFAGRVTALSPNRVAAPSGTYYKADIALDDVAAARREGLTLQPGIPASINIKTKDRTLFGYLFSPFVDAISRSLREE